MITFRFLGRSPTPGTAEIGMETDQQAETLRFILPQIADDQSAQLLMILPDGTPEALNIVDGLATVPAAVCAVPGRIRAWVEILSSGDSIAWNSEMLNLDVGDLPPISEEVERQFPTALQEALGAAASVLESKEEILEKYNEAKNALEAVGGAVASIQGMTAGAHAVDENAGASATLTETAGHRHLELGIPRGPQGVPGRNAVILNLAAVEIAFHITDGHLIMEYGDDVPPQFSINNQGHLIYSF